MSVSDRELSYGLLRIALGVNFAGHGLTRIYNGVGAFAATTAEHMAKSPLPHGFVLGLPSVFRGLKGCSGLRSCSACSREWPSPRARCS